jgi:ribosomal protein S18 acetylase RimI-like enzyme
VTDTSSLAHRNLADFTRFVGGLERGAAVLDEGGVVAAAGPGSFPTARQAVRLAGPAAAAADAIVAFYDAHGRSGTVFTRVGDDDDLTDALKTHGFNEWAQTPEMVCEQTLEPRGDAWFATTADDIAAYARIAGEAFTHLMIPAEVTQATLDNPDRMLQRDVIVAIASRDGEPVAGAMAALCGPEPLAYVGWVSCADSARGHGLGDVVTRALTNEAFARGATMCTLEASQFGEHTYARMGYREIYRYRIMIRV